MQAIKIKEGVYSVGVQNPDLRIFDIIMYTKYGTTYNAYLVQGQEKTALIETVKDNFFDEYIEGLQEIIDLQSVDYLVLNHTEPDHSGSVAKLLEKIPNITVIGSTTALKFLREIANTKFKSREVQQGDSIDLGGKSLHFISAPFLHWPDSMYTYLPEDKILFTCDSFGSHYADTRVFNDLIDIDKDSYYDAYKYYYDCIMSPFKPYVLEALEKIKDLDIEIICPGHGPILRSNLEYYIDLYRQWSQPPVKDLDRPGKIVMAYVTAYGYTGMISDSIIEGLKMVADFEVKKFNLVENSVQEVLAELPTADGLLIGSPTLNGDALPPIWELLTHLSPITNSDLVAGAFGAYGWSGEAVPNIEARLRALRMTVLPGLKINFKPSARNLDDAFNFGMDFGKMVLEKRQPKDKKKWRCLICGQVFEGEEPPQVCPACGVGQENFVPEALEDEYKQDTNENFIIIGSGIAALSAAEAIRKRNATATITMVTEESVKTYYRPALSDYLNEELPDDKFYVYDESWYEENQIQVKNSSRVASIDITGKKVVLGDGTSQAYDKLIIATGARSNIPPIKGVEKAGVYALRTLEDASQLKKALRECKQAVVIGGGVLGLEAVEEMLAMNIQVTVVEFSTRLMPRQLDEAASRRLQDLMEARGVKLCLGVGTEEILGDGRVNAVKLNNGEILEADLVLLSTGVKPNVELAKQAGLEVDRGIVVDASMRTSASDIYAAGDVAQIGDRMIGLWSTAREMGNVAGAAAAGDWQEYKEPKISTMLAAFDHEIFSIGEVNPDLTQCRVVEVWDPVENYYKKSYIKDGVLIGEIVIAPKVDASDTFRNLGRDSSGKLRVNKWKCQLCGYIHEGSEPPEECPVCGAPKDMFEPVV